MEWQTISPVGVGLQQCVAGHVSNDDEWKVDSERL
jgi:hypothetical protein